MVTTVKIRESNSSIKDILEALQYMKNNVVHSGVINADEQTVDTAELNEFGGISHYTRGPYMGEEVRVPARPFVGKSVERDKEKIKAVAAASFSSGITVENAKKALEAMGYVAATGQIKTLESNGEGISGWQKWQDFRTIATKGHARPLFTERMYTFPIDYEIVRRHV